MGVVQGVQSYLHWGMMAKLDNKRGAGSARRRLAWIPPFLAGATASVAAELAAGLLLYSALGFLRALTVVLVVEMGAFALGLWSARVPDGVQGLEWVRRRWFFALMTFTAAAAFSVAWSVFGEGAISGATQGLGLALLGALPMFSVAALLGAMERVDTQAYDTSRGAVGTWAAFGAASGFAATGLFFVPVLEPSSTLLVCVIALSGGALLYGWVADEVETRTVVESRWTPRGEVRVEDWVRGTPRRHARVLVEANRLRGGEDSGGLGIRPWEDAVLAGLRPPEAVEGLVGGDSPRRSILLFGLGTGTLARRLVNHLPDARLVGVEPSEDAWRLARAHFPVDQQPGDDPWSGIDARAGLRFDEVISRLGTPFDPTGAPYDLVIVDLSALGPLSPLPPFDPSALADVMPLLAPEASILLGPLALPDGARAGLDSWVGVENGFSSKVLFVHEQEALLALSRRREPAGWSLPNAVASWSDAGAASSDGDVLDSVVGGAAVDDGGAAPEPDSPETAPSSPGPPAPDSSKTAPSSTTPTDTAPEP